MSEDYHAQKEMLGEANPPEEMMQTSQGLVLAKRSKKKKSFIKSKFNILYKNNVKNASNFHQISIILTKFDIVK
jgi:hypothetical protein